MKYTREIIIAVLFVTVILLFFARGCGGNDDKIKALQAEAKALKEKVAQDSITRAHQRIAENAQLAIQRQETAAAIADKKAADKKLTATQATVLELAHRLQRYKNSGDTSTFTARLNNCDTLAAKVIEQDGQINDYRQQADEAVELLNYEVLLRDSVIEKEKSYSDSLRVDFNRQGQLLKTALAVGKPRGKFLAGAGVIGNQTTFLSGAKIAIAYQTKGGKQYQGGAILMGGTIWYEAGVLVTLFK